jgi:hypothetical protein
MHRNSNSRDVGSLVLEGGGRAGRFGRLLGSYFRADRTGIVAFGVILLLCASFAHAQTGIRWDLGAPGSAGAVAAAASGGLPTLLAQPGVTLAWCNHPANAVPCTNYATTYTSLLLSTPCATNAQIVLQGSTTCQAQSDFMGDLGVYTATNTVCTVTCYDYTLTVNGVSYGPYVWTQGGTSSGGGSLPTATAAGQYPNSTGAGTTYTAQSKAAIDVRDQGIDCTGATDSSTALNTLFTNISQKEVDFPQTCQIRADHQVVIFGQVSFVLHGVGDRPGAGGFGGPSIFGCNGAAGPLLYINRSGFGRIEGIGIYPKGPVGTCASSSFTQSVQVDNTGGGGVTTHDIIFDHDALTTNPQGTAVSGYIGLQLTSAGANNGEMIILRNSWLHCQNAANSIAFDNEAAASDKDTVEYNTINNCFIGTKLVGGNTTVQHNLFGSVGDFSVFGANGGAIWIGGCTSGALNILYNEHDSGGPFINSNNDTSGGCGELTIIGNALGISDIQNTAYPVNVGTTNGFYLFMANRILLTQSINQYLIGSSSQSGLNHGPLGVLWDLGTILGQSASTYLGVTNLGAPFQSGEFSSSGGSNVVLGQAGTNTLVDSFNHSYSPANANTSFAQQSPFLALRSQLGGSNFDDWSWQSIANAANSSLLFSHTKGAASNVWFNWDGSVSGLTLAQLTAPNAPGNVAVIGASGGTTYTYAIVAFGQTGKTAGSGTITINNGNATLNTTNYNQIQWTIPTGTANGYGANQYCVWRTVGGATQGNIGCVSAVGLTSNSLNGNVYYFNDQGAAGDGAALPTTNTTGGASLAPITVSNLPTAASSPGTIFRVSDSTVVAAEGQACVGGSTHNALAFSDGTAWKCF